MVMKFWFLEVCLVTTFLSIFSLFLLVIVCVAQRKPTIAHTLTISNSRRKVDQRGEPVSFVENNKAYSAACRIAFRHKKIMTARI